MAGEIGHCFVVGARHQLRASMSAGWRGSAGQVRRNFRQLSPTGQLKTKPRSRYVNMFEGPVTGNIPEVLDNGEVTEQLALALTPYAQVTDLAVNTAASGNNAAAIQSLDDRVTAELASKLYSSALAPAIAPLATAAAGHHTTGLSNKADHRPGGRGGHQEQRGPKLSNCSTNYGLKTVVDQHSLDIAARITP